MEGLAEVARGRVRRRGILGREFSVSRGWVLRVSGW